MIARKYDNYAWEEQYQYEQQPQIATEIKRAPAVNSNRAFMNKVYLIAFIIVATYLFSVVRSWTIVSAGNELVSLKQQEIQLINKNNELKIEVEELKGPERIRGIAEKQLGMSVARSNIYVKAADVKNNSVYAFAGN